MIKPSRYLDRFKAAEAAIKENVLITGSILLVEKAIPEEVKTKSGLIMASAAGSQINSIDANLPEFIYVLAVGEGYYDDKTGESVSLDAQVGDVGLVGKQSVTWFGSIGIDDYQPFTIGVVSESQIQLRFKGQQAIQGFVGAINGATGST